MTAKSVQRFSVYSVQAQGHTKSCLYVCILIEDKHKIIINIQIYCRIHNINSIDLYYTLK